MLKDLGINEINDAVELTWRLCNNAIGRSYLLFQSLADIETEYRLRINKEASALLGYYKGEELIGVLCYFYQPKELYLQTTSLVAKEDYQTVISSFLTHINKNHSGYEVYIGVTPEYTPAIDELKSFGYRQIEASSDMRLRKKSFLPKIISDNIVERIDKANFHEYLDFHKAHFENIYWNAKRLQEKLDDWYIFVRKEDGKISGGIFMTVNHNYAEIFGMAMINSSDTINAVGLLSKAIAEVLIENSEIDDVIFFVDDKDKINLAASIECGFQTHSKYCCYYLKV